MSDLLVVTPSRGRPDNARELAAAMRETGSSDLCLAIDEDDPAADAYLALGDDRVMVSVGPPGGIGMTAALNSAALELGDGYDYVGFLGDDHRPKTPRWDAILCSELDAIGGGIAYGNDLVHGEGLPTAAVMSTWIIETLGYMAPPRQHHLYLDSFWLEFGKRLGYLVYRADVVIEHLHPIVGKAEWDEGYRRVNDVGMYEHDRVEFERYLAEEMDEAVRSVRG